MKKVLFYLSLCVLVSGSCAKLTDEIQFNDFRLTEFVKSSDYYDLVIDNNLLSAFGSVSPLKSYVTEIMSENSTIPVLNIVIERGNKITGSLVAIKLQSSENELKTGHKYAIVLCDTRNFDFSTLSGLYEVYDVNYDLYKAVKIESSNNRIMSVTTYNMPSEIIAKYQFSHGTSKTHPCDSSQDGNISFGECYGRLKKAISSDGTAEFMCNALDIGFLCSGSVAAACVLISSIR